MSEKLRSFGIEVRELRDRVLTDRERPPVAKRLANVHRALARQKRKHAWSGHLLTAAASCFVTAAVLFVLSSRSGAPLIAQHAGQPVDTGAWLESNETPWPLTFSDGTSLTLAAPSRARLVRVDEQGAELALERGAVHASVVKRSGARWIVSAGPFKILVTGTRFDASWDPAREVLDVSTHEGSVRVSGSCVQPKSLSAGESSAFSCGKELADNPARNAESKPSSPETPRTEPSRHSPIKAAPQGSTSASPARDWQTLSREGRFKEALAAAEAEGFSTLCTTTSADQLLDLGNVARLAGNPSRASEAFLALRQRFPGAPGAAVASFHLGRIAFDGRHDYSSARRWFTTYLGEQPGGRFAEEALGRLMESEHRLGDRAAAEATAVRYLERFPTGGHAALAQSLTGK